VASQPDTGIALERLTDHVGLARPISCVSRTQVIPHHGDGRGVVSKALCLGVSPPVRGINYGERHAPTSIFRTRSISLYGASRTRSPTWSLYLIPICTGTRGIEYNDLCGTSLTRRRTKSAFFVGGPDTAGLLARLAVGDTVRLELGEVAMVGCDMGKRGSERQTGL